MKNKQQLIENPEKGSKRQNREMAVVTYLVMAIFFILAGYMVYFITVSYTHLTLPTKA